MRGLAAISSITLLYLVPQQLLVLQNTIRLKTFLILLTEKKKTGVLTTVTDAAAVQDAVAAAAVVAMVEAVVVAADVVAAAVAINYCFSKLSSFVLYRSKVAKL